LKAGEHGLKITITGNHTTGITYRDVSGRKWVSEENTALLAFWLFWPEVTPRVY